MSNEVFHQTLAVLTVFFNEFCLGIDVGWLSSTLILLQKDNPDMILTAEECSRIASLDYFGKIFGALLSALLIDLIGRKYLLIFTSLVFFIQWLITMFASSALILYATRIIFGIAWGITENTNMVYLGENSTPMMRGIFGSISISMYFLAITIELSIASNFSFFVTATINAAVTLLAFLSVFWLKEPAQFLLFKGNQTKAMENFMWLRGVTDPNDVKNEFEKISHNVTAEKSKKSSLKKTFTSPANYRSIYLITIIYALVAVTGYVPIMLFATIFFSQPNIFLLKEPAILLGVAQFLAASTSSFVINRFNRRSIILTSFSIITVFHACAAIVYYINDKICPVPYFSWLIFFCIVVYVSVFAFVYPATLLIRGELFPLSVKALGGSLSIIVFVIISLRATKMFVSILIGYKMYVNFAIFSIFSVILVVFVYLFLPETRNKSLIEIQESLEKHD